MECYFLGYRSFVDQDKCLDPYCEQQLMKRYKQLEQAAGTAGEAKLFQEVNQLEQIRKEIKRWN